MDYVNVFLYYGGKWDELNNYNDYSVSGILVPMECTYIKLVEMIMKELNCDPTKDAVSLQYQVNTNMPLIKLSSNNSISFYLELKKKEQDVTKYPLCVDVGPVSQDREHIGVLVYYGGKWDQFNNYKDYSAIGILVPRECTYIKLVEMIVKGINLGTTRDAITMQYQVNENMPLMKISNNNSVSFYLELKKNERDVRKYPLCVDVAPVSHGNGTETFEDISLSQDASVERGNKMQLRHCGRDCSETSSPQRLPTIEDIDSEVSHSNRTETFQDIPISQDASVERCNKMQLQLRGRHCSETLSHPRLPTIEDVDSEVSHSNRTDTFEDVSLSQVASFEEGNIMQLEHRGRRRLEISSPTRLLSIEEMAAEICDSIPDPEEMDDETETYVISHPTVDGIAKNRIYQSKELLKTSIALYAIQNRFQFKVHRSDRKEYVLKCLDDNCSWSFRASKIGEMDMFKIRYMKNSHTCKLDVVSGHHRQATSSFVASCIKYNYLSPGTIYTPSDIMKDMMNTYGVWMSYEKAWRAREQALLEDRAVLAPMPKRRPGRPKAKGIISTGEKEQVTRCGRCGEFGHNRRSCKIPPPTKIKSDRKRKSPDSPTCEDDQKKKCSEPICAGVDETEQIITSVDQSTE